MYAGFWKRFLAFIIDDIICWFIVMAFLLLLYVLHGGGFSYENNAMALILNIIAWGLCCIYFAAMESSSWQATLGKKLLGIKVTDAQGRRLSFIKALLRTLSKIISTIILLIGFIMAAFTQKKQALHDIIVGALVVNNNFSAEETANQPSQKSSVGLVIALVVAGLFVVVLIVGLLAAIALPQYFKAVEKSRAVEAVVMLNSFQRLRNQQDFSTWQDMPIEIAWQIRPDNPNIAETANFAFIITTQNMSAVRKNQTPNRYAFTSNSTGIVCVVEQDEMRSLCGDYTVKVSPGSFK